MHGKKKRPPLDPTVTSFDERYQEYLIQGEDGVFRAESDERPEQCELDQPCNKCPFRIESLPGYLGPYHLTELHEVIMMEVYFPCHKTIKVGEPENVDDTSFCVGALIYMLNCIKTPRDERIHQAMEYYRERVDHSSVLDYLGYIRHHAAALEVKDAE